MTNNWQRAAQRALDSTIERLTAVGGGDFAQSYCAQLAGGEQVFIKTHSNPPAGFFSTEAAGLKWLHDTTAVAVPEVRAFSDDPPFLALHWIDVSVHGVVNSRNEADFGRSLAQLHRVPQHKFGRVDGRTTGSLALSNQPCSSWAEFFATRRLLPLAEIARNRNAMSSKDINAVERLAQNLDTLDIPVEPPSLLHGDLWAGNRLVDTDGVSWLIDPAAHNSHREFDLAMMQLFGGFGSECFAAYNEAYPLQRGWQRRISLHQLAPLIVHAIKFGSAYIPPIRKALKDWR